MLGLQIKRSKMGLTKAALNARDLNIGEMLNRRKPSGEYAYTLELIGDSYSITRERVRQIGKKLGITARQADFNIRKKKLRDDAPQCSVGHCNGKVKILNSNGGIGRYAKRCKAHGRDVVLITCAECGKESERERYQVHTGHRPNPVRTKPQEHWFCNKLCQGRFIGREYGFTAHPENSYQAKTGRMHGVSLAELREQAHES